MPPLLCKVVHIDPADYQSVARAVAGVDTVLHPLIHLSRS